MQSQRNLLTLLLSTLAACAVATWHPTYDVCTASDIEIASPPPGYEWADEHYNSPYFQYRQTRGERLYFLDVPPSILDTPMERLASEGHIQSHRLTLMNVGENGALMATAVVLSGCVASAERVTCQADHTLIDLRYVLTLSTGQWDQLTSHWQASGAEGCALGDVNGPCSVFALGVLTPSTTDDALGNFGTDCVVALDEAVDSDQRQQNVAYRQVGAAATDLAVRYLGGLLKNGR